MRFLLLASSSAACLLHSLSASWIGEVDEVTSRQNDTSSCKASALMQRSHHLAADDLQEPKDSQDDRGQNSSGNNGHMSQNRVDEMLKLGDKDGYAMLHDVRSLEHAAASDLRLAVTAILDFSLVGMGSCSFDDGTRHDIGWSSKTCPTYPCTAAMPCTLEECAAECTSHAACAAFNYYNDHCWLFSAPADATYTQGDDAFHWYECYVKNPTTTTTTITTTTTTTTTTTSDRFELMRSAWRCSGDTNPTIDKMAKPEDCEVWAQQKGYGYFCHNAEQQLCTVCSGPYGAINPTDQDQWNFYSRTIHVTTSYASGKQCNPSLRSSYALGGDYMGDKYWPHGFGTPLTKEQCGEFAALMSAPYFDMGEDGKCYTCGLGLPAKDGTSEDGAIEGVSNNLANIYEVVGYRVVADNSECPVTDTLGHPTRKQTITAGSLEECMRNAFKLTLNSFDYGPDNICSMCWYEHGPKTWDFSYMPALPRVSHTLYVIENAGFLYPREDYHKKDFGIR